MRHSCLLGQAGSVARCGADWPLPRLIRGGWCACRGHGVRQKSRLAAEIRVRTGRDLFRG
jgi:hypothetical protein